MRIKAILGALSVAALVTAAVPQAAEAQGMMHRHMMMHHNRMMMHHDRMMMHHDHMMHRHMVMHRRHMM